MTQRYRTIAGLALGTLMACLLGACNKTDTPSSSAIVAPNASTPAASPVVVAPAPPAAQPSTQTAPAYPAGSYTAPSPPPPKKSYPQASASEISAFINAAELGNVAGVKRYMASGYDIDRKAGDHRRYGTRAGHTAVSRAAYAGRLAVVRLLVESGAYVDGDSLRAGALGGNPKIVRYLLDAGIKFNRNELSIAAVSGVGNPAILGMLLDAGADPNFRVDKGWTPLTFAAADGKVESVRLLLARGANPNDQGSRDTPLIMAAYGGHLPTIKLLVAAGANPNAVGNDGRTPHQAAMSARKREAAEFLGAQAGGRPSHGGGKPSWGDSRQQHRGDGRQPHGGARPPLAPPTVAPVVGVKPPPAPPAAVVKPVAPPPPSPPVASVKPVPPAGVVKPQDNSAANLACQVQSRGTTKQMIVTYKLGEQIYAISDPAIMRAKRRGWIDGKQKFSQAEMQDLLKRGAAKCP